MDLRAKQIQLIHVGKSKLGMSEAGYRTLLGHYGAKSSTELDERGRKGVLKLMRLLGFVPQRKGRPRPAGERERLVRKVRALLINAPGGARPDAYADSIAQRMFKVEYFEWCTPDQLHRLVAALEIDKRRGQS